MTQFDGGEDAEQLVTIVNAIVTATDHLLGEKVLKGVESMSTRPLHFNAFIWPSGYHEAAWRVVDGDVRNACPTTPTSRGSLNAV